MGSLGLILGTVGALFLLSLCKAFLELIWSPYVTAKKLGKQGVRGPKYRFMVGSLDEIKAMESAARKIEMDARCHEIIPRVLPHYYQWMQQYGDTFVYWYSSCPRLYISDPELAKQVLQNKSGFYPKPKPLPGIFDLMGNGLVLSEGEDWARHRRILNPAFAMDKLKLLTKQIAECSLAMIKNCYEETHNHRNAIDITKQFQNLTANVISRAVFGSDHCKGMEVFSAQQQLAMLTFASKLKLPFLASYLPTKMNRQKWAVERKINGTLMNIIKSRLNSKDSGYGDGFIGLMLESTRKQVEMKLSLDEIVDECKTFFFAGHETTSELLTWTTFLLSIYPEWQDRLRDEVKRVCGDEIPNADNIGQLKLVTMVLWEALRLYSPVLMSVRMANKDIKLGNMVVPKDTTVAIPLAVIHHNKELWGDDASEFNPLRFQNGVNKAAKNPNALFAFSVGPRTCIGQDLVMVEAKTVVSMILQRFSFSLSPEYKHKPTNLLTLQPQDGLPIVLKPLPV